MSGGHWNYASHRIREHGDTMREIAHALAWLEHEVDYAYCSDGCGECARLASFDWLCLLFDVVAGDARAEDAKFEEIAERNKCARCSAMRPTP